MENNIKLMVIYGDLVMNKEDYFKYYIQGSDHYLIPKDVFIELFEEMENWREEAKELNQKYLNAVADYETTMAEKKEMENQQKEFIEYLENEIKRLEKTEFYIDSIQKAAIETHKHNLSKYKEIIGGK